MRGELALETYIPAFTMTDDIRTVKVYGTSTEGRQYGIHLHYDKPGIT